MECRFGKLVEFLMMFRLEIESYRRLGINGLGEVYSITIECLNQLPRRLKAKERQFLGAIFA